MKQYSKRFLAGGLAACMLLGLLPGVSLVPSASAEEYTDPYGFTLTGQGPIEGDENPYGQGKFNFMAVPELNLYQSGSNFERNKVFDVAAKTSNMDFRSGDTQNTSGNIDTVKTAKSFAANSSPAELKLASGVAYDPLGSGRDDHIAYYGFNNVNGAQKNCPTVLIFNATKGGNNRWPSGTSVRFVSREKENYNYVDSGNLNDDNYEGFTAITAGDFDGDGKDSLVIYDPAKDVGTTTDSMILRESTNQGSSWNRIQSLYKVTRSSNGNLFGKCSVDDIQAWDSSNDAVARNTAMVRLSAADVDNDQKDELLVTVSLGNMLGEHSDCLDRSSVLTVLDYSSSGDWKIDYQQQMTRVNFFDRYANDKELVGYMRSASSVASDVDGDGALEIVTVGAAFDTKNSNDDYIWSDGLCAVVTDITTDAQNKAQYVTPTTDKLVDNQKCLKGSWLKFRLDDAAKGDSWAGFWDYYANNAPASLAGVCFDGLGTAEYIVAQGLIYYYDVTAGELKPVYRNAYDQNQDNFLNSCSSVRQPVVGNFDGNDKGREQVYFIGRNGFSYRLFGWSYSGSSLRSLDRDKTTAGENQKLTACNWQTSVILAGAPFACLTAPDIDKDDGMVAEFTDKELAYTDPEIMAILEAAPYFEDLKDDYANAAATSFGKGSGSGSGQSEASSTKAGTYMSFSQEFSIFGVTVASVEMEAAYEAEWSGETSMETSYETGMDFSTGTDENQVVMLRTPVTVYHYNTWDAHGNQSEIAMNSPGKPVYQMLSLEDYNKAADATGGPQIGKDIISCEPGRPGSYRQSTAGLTNANLASEAFMSTSTGTGMSTLSFSEEQSETVTNTLTHSIDAKAGGGAGGVTIGASFGSSSSRGTSTTNTKSVTREGQVMQLPASGGGDYGFKWNLLTWDAHFGSGDDGYTVPVVGYLVQEVRQPPSLPLNIEAASGDAGDSVKLTWEAGDSAAAKYEIYRYVEGGTQKYYLVGTVAGGVTEFTESGLQPGTRYQYSIRATDGDKVSGYSAPVDVVTASTDGVPKILEQPQDTSVKPGNNAAFSVSAIPVGEQGLTIQWQCRPKGERTWTGVGNGGTALTLQEVTADMDKNEYRCMVSELGGGDVPVFVYSSSAVLSVGKTGSTTKVTAGAGAGAADHTEEKTESVEQTVIKQYKVGEGADAKIYLRYNNVFDSAGTIFPEKNGEYVYYCQTDNTHYILEGLSETASADETGTVTATVTATVTGKIPLTQLDGCLYSGTGAAARRVAKLSDLRSTVQQTETIKIKSGESVSEVDCNVFTATGVAHDVGTPTTPPTELDPDVLRQETLTVYQKKDTPADAAYYVAFPRYGTETVKDKEGNDIEVSVEIEPELKALTEKKDAYGDKLAAEDNLTYLTATLTRVYSDSAYAPLYINADGTKAEAPGAGVTAYNTVFAGAATLYENAGIYYTCKTEEKDVTPPPETPQAKAAEKITVYTFTPLTNYTTSGETLQSLLGKVAEDGTVSHTAQRAKDDEVETVAITTEVKKVEGVSGSPVTLTATVTTPEDWPSGYVSFEIVNTATGAKTSLRADLKRGNDEGTATVDWTPAAPGVYVITAKYGGDSTVLASLGATTYHAYGAEKTGLDLALPEAPQYGDTITAKVNQWTADDKGTVTKKDASGYTFAAYPKSAAGDTDADGDGYSDTPVNGWTGSGSLDPGEYLIKAASESAAGLSKVLAVSKRPVTIAAPKETTLAADAVKDHEWGEPAYDGLLAADADFKAMFSLNPSSVRAAAGNYNITVKVDGGAGSYGAFLAKYIPTYEQGVVTVTEDAFAVTFSAGANGTLKATDQTENASTFQSGAAIPAGHKLLFAATPSAGFSVSKWLVNDTVVDGDTTGVTVGKDKTTLTIAALSVATDVKAEFTNQNHTLTFTADENGKLAAKVLGSEVSSGGSVTGGSDVVLTAQPDAGYVVDKWEVSTGTAAAVTQTNPDGTTYTAPNLTLKNLSANTAVTVAFAATADYTVAYGAEKPDGTPVTAGVTLTAKGLKEDGKTAVKGSDITFTATPTTGVAVLSWEVKRGGAEKFTKVADSVLAYTLYNVQEDTKVRAVVNTEAATSYKLDFAVVDGEGKTVSAGGTLAATAGGAPVASGAAITAYTKVDFAFTETDAYEVVEWKVNNTSAQTGHDKLAYSIDSIGQPTTVNVVVKQKPMVSVTGPAAGGTLAAAYTLGGAEALPKSGYVYTGTVAAVTATPAGGYVVNTILGNGTPVLINDKTNGAKTQKVTITAATAFSAAFTAKPTVTIGDAEHGSLTVTGTVDGATKTLSTGEYVDFNTKITVTATPASGYVVDTINDEAVNTGKANGEKSKTADVPDAGISVGAAFLAKPVVTIDAADGGEAAVTGTADGEPKTLSTGGYVDFGSVLNVTLKPETGFEVDGSITAAATATDDKTYTVDNVQADQTVTPAFTAIPQHGVTFSVVDTGDGAHGALTAAVTRKEMADYAATLTESGEAYRDSNVTFTAAPEQGYRVQEWTVNGERQTGAATTLTLENLQADAEVTVQFVLLGDKTTVTAGGHGLITGAMVGGNTDVLENIEAGFNLAEGASVTVTAAPDTGYEVQAWRVNGEEVTGETGTEYTYTALSGETGAAIEVVFQPAKYAVSWGGGNGTVTAGGQTGGSADIRGGTAVTFTAEPDAGYTLTGWTVDGETQENANTTFTWTVPLGAAAETEYVIEAQFARGAYAVTLTQPEHAAITADWEDLAAVTGGTDVTFTAVPDDDYLVTGWTVDGAAVPDTQSNTYTLTVDKAVTVTAALAPAHYDVTYAVSGAGGAISAAGYEGSPASVPYGEDIVFTAAPDEYWQVGEWTVDGETVTEGVRGKTELTLSDVTKAHSVSVFFSGAVRYEVGYAVADGNGTLSATNNGEALTLGDSQTAQVLGNSELVFTAKPSDTSYMLDKWEISKDNGKTYTAVTRENRSDLGVTMTHPLSNVLTVEKLTGALRVRAAFTAYAGFALPTDGTGYTVSGVTCVPDDTSAGEIRKGGDLTFTVGPNGASGYSTISELKLGEADLLDSTPDAGITVVKNANGSYTVTVTGVQAALALTATAHKLVIENDLSGYTVPEALKEKGLETTAKIESALKTKLSAARDGKNVIEIALKYYDGEKSEWVEVAEENFPANGVDVTLAYPAGTNSRDRFTIVHMLTTGENAGTTETITPTKEKDGLHFHVDSLSPFGVGWTKYVSSGGGGGGGGVAAEDNVVLKQTENGTVAADPTNARKGGTVTVTATPDKGYAVAEVTVTDKNGKKLTLTDKGDGVFTFVMPDGAVTVTATFAAAAGWVNPFRDVAGNAWYFDAVRYAAAHGLFSGTSADTFSPDAAMTRAMLATVLYRAAGEPSIEDEIWGYPFADVDADAYYGTAVYWARLEGIVTGTSAETFSPDSPITREQLAVMLYRYAGSPAASAGRLEFADAEAVSAYASDALVWATAEGVVTGKPGNLLDPKGSATRAEVAAMLMRHLTAAEK